MLDTYENLKLSIINWSHREDMDLLIDDFIDIAEAEMFANPVEPLKARSGETRAAFTTSTSDRFVALPTGYISMRKARIQITNGPSIELEYRTPAQLNLKDTVGTPLYFTVTDQVELDRISDQAYTGEFQYNAEFTALSTSNTTNAILTNHPNIYLYGSLWALFNHAVDTEQASKYYASFIDAIRGANKEAKAGRYGPAPVMRIEGATP